MEKWCRKVLSRSVVVKCCGEGVCGSGVQKVCRGVLWRSGVEECCR